MIQTKNLGYNALLSFKKGGKPSINDERKKKLFPFFAYIYSKQMNPEKYGSAVTMEEWTSLIQSSKEDIDTITKAATQLTDEDWNNLESQYTEATKSSEEEIQLAKKGAKLKKLKAKVQSKKSPVDQVSESVSNPVITQAKGGKTKKRKCSCGCDLVLSKGKGGKLTETCSCKCGGKMKKKK